MSSRKSLYLQISVFIFSFIMISQSLIPYSMGTLLPKYIQPEYIQDAYIVVLKDKEDPQDVGFEMKEMYGFELGQVYQYALKGFSANIPSVIVDMVKRDPRVKYIEQDKKFYCFGQVSPTGISRIGAALNTDRTNKETDVDIAIIDSGIDLDHRDLNVVENVSFVPGFSNGDDDVGHGTHVAGIIAARDNGIDRYDGIEVVGVAPGARLHAVKVMAKNMEGRATGDLSWIISGVEWVTKKADESDSQNNCIDVANMSLGAPGHSQALREAIKNSVNKGVVYVVAAGNAHIDIYGEDGIFGTDDDIEPASYPEVATISAMADSDGKCGGMGNPSYDVVRDIYGNYYLTNIMFDDTMATFSNFSNYAVRENPVSSPGKAIDLAAPGVDILSTFLNGTYTTMDGTSMAAPHVAGCVALYIAEHGRAHNASDVVKIRQALIDNAESQKTDSQTNCLGWGPADTLDIDKNPEGLVNLRFDSPKVTIINPASGSKLKNNEDIIIRVDINYHEWMNKVGYSINNGEYNDMSYNENGGYWEAKWNVSKEKKGDYTIKVLARDRRDNEGSASVDVNVVNVDITSPPCVGWFCFCNPWSPGWPFCSLWTPGWSLNNSLNKGLTYPNLWISDFNYPNSILNSYNQSPYLSPIVQGNTLK